MPTDPVEKEQRAIVRMLRREAKLIFDGSREGDGYTMAIYDVLWRIAKRAKGKSKRIEAGSGGEGQE